CTWAAYKAESKVSAGRGQACLVEGLQGDRGLNGPSGRLAWWSRDSGAPNIGWPPSGSSSLKLCLHDPDARRPSVYVLATLPDVLQKYRDKSLLT
ncbi:hypothetical protein D4Z77_08900, partial [Campylobacter coli]